VPHTANAVSVRSTYPAENPQDGTFEPFGRTLPLYHFKGSPNDKLRMRLRIRNVIWRMLV